ncbi:electron transfer flavoprotein subunit alpha [Jeongeupia sp. HS-3]|uniref:electron transfer flavoprotein subunit alpha/FixB family protein n=1 Tax=Jeongeupia sp. HS-3 TaxID=1009682 RepID=UPI0018A66C06|nr:FAD-binding protein [Jeongeupia sp. HS-3]BCL76264.1 electron transfer flavoprotein subunit alpha [Jeongeupia sp. HS-3]
MSVLILADHDGRQLKAATRRAIGAAKAWSAPIHVLVVGSATASVAEQAAKLDGVAKVLRVDAAHLAHPLAADVANIIKSLAGDFQVILAPHTTLAKDVLPRVAGLLDVAMIADAVEITAPSTYVRPIYAGNLLATVESSDAIQVVTVRATSFPAAAEAASAAAIESLAAPAADTRVRWVSESRNASDRPELASARVVVAGGRSFGERFEELLGPLADKLGGAIGATRAAVDAGFAPNEQQVGQTGTVVAPELYIAAGISGAQQHLAGMKDSQVIVAINHDPDAAIFQVADFGLVADLFDAVPQLTKALEQ